MGGEQLTNQFWWVCLSSPSVSNTKSITRAQVKQQTMKGIRGWVAEKEVKSGWLSVYLSICLYECVFNKKVMIHVCFSAILTASQKEIMKQMNLILQGKLLVIAVSAWVPLTIQHHSDSLHMILLSPAVMVNSRRSGLKPRCSSHMFLMKPQQISIRSEKKHPKVQYLLGKSPCI